ncbi:uncharacterized protein LOC127084150 [Lathyrus oleraceus]|uniref:GrpE protein homolog n=1 Tax=Pisum sativum TaxID=3888 RepID=A0A9D4WU13_PEA|nr:uncharacterized protein LOC127084150 [Pisum sativum]KAI5407892.1 hypothetical protein KIW84_053944 [Pisum sativum]
MATSLSNQFLLGCCSCSSKSPQQPKFARFPSRPFSASNTLLGFPTPFPSLHPTPLFASSQTNIETETEEIQIDEDRKNLPRLGVLIESYKKAFLTGDEKIAIIEERIQLKENEKNKLVQKVSTLSVDKVSVKEQYLRLQADFDNFRKKCDKERVGIQSDAKQGFIKKLLLMADNFERVKQQIEAATEKEKKIDVSYQSIYKQFVETLRSHHVSVVATVGKPFNPLLHEAIAREESEVFKEGIIIKESRRGFVLKDKVLRPAFVKVSLGPGNKKSSVAPAKSVEQPSTAARIDER